MNDIDLKRLLALAESYYTRYEWDQAIACFEAVLKEYPDHAAAAQGLAGAIEQRQVEYELGETIVEARAAFEAGRYGEALASLNRAQTRAAMRHILKYHAEIDGLRTQAQESLEWQRRVEVALAEARRLAGQKQLDAALHVLDTAWHGLAGRGMEALGQELRRERERLWAERDLEQQIADAEAAFSRQDYRLACDLAGAVREQFPNRADIARMHERFGLLWENLQGRLAAVHESEAAGRLDDAVALLLTLRRDWPENPDWRALWLKVQADHARAQVEAGRGAVGEHRFDQAAAAFRGARESLAAALDVFEGHPTIAAERDEAEALYGAAAAAGQAARDSAAGRWDVALRGWQAAAEGLRQAAAARGRDFGDVTTVIEGMLGTAADTVAALDQARLLLAEGQEALAGGDAAGARERFRAGMGRAERGGGELREQLQAGLRAADQAQRDARTLLARAERAQDRDETLALLRRAYERWRTAPGVADRLAAALLDASRLALVDRDEEAALGYCEQALSLAEAEEAGRAPGGVQAEAAELALRIGKGRQARAAVAEAKRVMAETSERPGPSAAAYRQVLDTLRAAPLEAAPELREAAAELEQQARERHLRHSAAEAHLERAELARQRGDWAGAAAGLGDAVSLLEANPAGAAAPSPLAARLAEWQAVAAGLDKGLAEARGALAEARKLYQAAAGDLAAVDWAGLRAALDLAGARLAASPAGADPLPADWAELSAAGDELASRVGLLHEAYLQIEAGRRVEALMALAQPGGGQTRGGQRLDLIRLRVLRRLQEEAAGEVGARAAALAAGARESLARGDMAEARRRVAEARLCVSAGGQKPEVVETVERQADALDRIRMLAARVASDGWSVHGGGSDGGGYDYGSSGRGGSPPRPPAPRAATAPKGGAEGGPYDRGAGWRPADRAATEGRPYEGMVGDSAGWTATEGRPYEGMAACRAALEVAAGEEAGFPPNVRRDLDVLLDQEDALWDAEALQEAQALFRRLEQAAADDPLMRNYLLAPLRRWWKLARRAAAVDFIIAHLFVGDPAAAYARAAAAFAADPTDATLRELFVRSRQELWSQRQRLLARRVACARRLVERGAYAEALATLEEVDAGREAPSDENLPGDLAALLVEAGELRLELTEISELAQRLAPVAERAQAALAEGRAAAAVAEAVEALDQAAAVDLRRRCTVLWRDLDAAAALLAARGEQGKTRQAGEPAGEELPGQRVGRLTPAGEELPEGRHSPHAPMFSGEFETAGAEEKDAAAAETVKAGRAAIYAAPVEPAMPLAHRANGKKQAGGAGQPPATPPSAMPPSVGSSSMTAPTAAEPTAAALSPTVLPGAAPADDGAERESVKPGPAGQPGASAQARARGSSPAGNGLTGDGSNLGSSSLDREQAPQPAAADGHAPAGAEAAVEIETLAAFDISDWLSNVTPLLPEEDEDDNAPGPARPAPTQRAPTRRAR